MAFFDTRIRNARNRRYAGSRLIQMGLNSTTAAEVVTKLPAWLVERMARQLEVACEIREGEFVAEGKPLAVAEADFDDALRELRS